MIELLDRQRSLTINQWKIFAVVMLSIVLETRGRAIEELDATLGRPKPIAARPV